MCKGLQTRVQLCPLKETFVLLVLKLMFNEKMVEEINEIKAFGKHAALLLHLVTTVCQMAFVQCCAMKFCFLYQ